MSLKDMRDELRNLRKEKMKPISRMKKSDIALELERMRGKREETPPVASTAGAKPKKEVGKEMDVKKAKEKEFPVKPVDEAPKKKAGKKATVVGGSGAIGEKTKVSKRDMLKKMIEEMSSSDEE